MKVPEKGSHALVGTAVSEDTPYRAMFTLPSVVTVSNQLFKFEPCILPMYLVPFFGLHPAGSTNIVFVVPDDIWEVGLQMPWKWTTFPDL